jgi:hypothetical protein
VWKIFASPLPVSLPKDVMRRGTALGSPTMNEMNAYSGSPWQRHGQCEHAIDPGKL